VSDLDNSVNGFYRKVNFDTMFKEAKQVANTSIKSSLIECRYYFKVTTNYDTFCCSYDPPTVYFPINIYSPAIITEERVKPGGWNPISMPEFSISSSTNIPDVQLTTSKLNNSVLLTSTSKIETTVIRLKTEKKIKHNKVRHYDIMVTTSYEPVQSSPMITTSYEPVQSSPMITTSYEPVQSSPMITTSYEPVQSSPMITTSYEPVQSSPMITTSYEPVQSSALVTSSKQPNK
jgi:hypothetical protein